MPGIQALAGQLCVALACIVGVGGQGVVLQAIPVECSSGDG